MKTDELIERLQKQEQLWLLEKLHLRNVVAQGLDDSTARWVVEIRAREIIKLKAWLRKMQRDEVADEVISLDRRRRRAVARGELNARVS